MDSIILVSVNPEEKKAALISIPRDLYLSLPTDYDNTTNHKINAAYSIGADNVMFPNKRPEFKGENGGWALMKYAVEVVTGFPVQYFIAVDFQGYQKAIDILDGVTVDVAGQDFAGREDGGLLLRGQFKAARAPRGERGGLLRKLGHLGLMS